MRSILGSLILLACAASAQAAGTVQVSFVEPEKFTDVRDASMRREDHLANLQRHLEQIGAQYTADGQTLKIEVLDVDLAGEPRRAGFPNDLRVLRGRADWPRIELRWTLEAPGAAPRGGKASVADMAYLQHVAVRYASEPLPYERRMLEDWFRKDFSALSR